MIAIVIAQMKNEEIMKLIMYTFYFFMILFLFAGCDTVENNDTVNGSGFLVNNILTHSDFTKIETGFAFESTIRKDSV